jgi:mannosyltransferase
MANSLVDPKELQPAPPPASAPSAFLWCGLVMLLVAAIVGAIAIIQQSSSPDASPGRGLYVALLIFLGGVTLLYAQARYLFWRKAAGIVELHPLAPVAHRVRDPHEAHFQRGDLLLLLVLTLLALLPRFPALNSSLWYDELWTLEFMRQGPLYALTHQGGFNNHLLNSLLGNLILQAFGMTESATLPPAWMVRLPAFTFGVLAVPMLYLAAREAFGRWVGLAAAVLLAFSPAAVDFSTQARGYSFLIFFTIAQAYFLCRALRLTSAAAWVGWLVCSVLGVMAHLYFVFVVGLNLIYLCGRAIWRSAYLRSHPHAIALIEQAVVLTVAWAILFCAVYLGVGTEMLAEAKRTSEGVPVAHAREVMLPLLQLWGGVPQDRWLTIFYVVCGLLALFGVWYLARQPSGGAVYLPLLLLAPPLVVELVRPHYVYMRFFAFGLPLFLTLLACGMAQVAHWITGPSRQSAAWRNGTHLLLAGLFCLLCLPGLLQVIRLPKQDYQGAADALRMETSADARVVIGSGANWFQQYGVNLQLAETEDALVALARGRKTLAIVDTDLTVNPRLRTPLVTRLVRKVAERPERVFRGRFAGWPHRWLDGDSDMKLYRVDSTVLLGKQ